MSYEPSAAEVIAVSSLSPSKRFSYLVNNVADWEEIWSVGDDNGWALMADISGKELVPVWPAKKFAQLCCVGDWVDYQPRPIGLKDWLEKWTPGTTDDGRSVAVFPLSSDQGIVATPLYLSEHLLEALAQYE